jgi:putative sigma-54 modulation protein
MENFMDIRIMARHFDLTDSLKNYINQKLARVLRHCEQVIDVLVVMDSQKVKDRTKQHHVEVSIHLKGKHIIAENTHFDMYAAIDGIMDKLDRQVIKNNRIRHEHYHDKHSAFMLSEVAEMQMAAQSEKANQIT